jgi:hypothetical protein
MRGQWFLSLRASPRRGPVLHAPELRARALAVALGADDHELHEDLRRREVPLVFMASAAGAPMLRSWPGAPGPCLPVFADVEWLQRVAAELGARPALASLPRVQLYTWAREQQLTLALNVYLDSGEARYVMLDSRRLLPSRPGSRQ